MADINLTRGAQLAAQIIAEGGNWRDIESLLDGGAELANSVLASEGRGELGLDKFYKDNVEYGADQADLQPNEAAKFNSESAPDPTYLRGASESTEEGNERRRAEFEAAQGRGTRTRSAEDGSSKLRRRSQQAIADEAYEREARKRGESSEAKYLRQQNEQMARRSRERKIIGGEAPKANTASALDQLGAVIKSGTLSPVEQEKAERVYSRLRASTDAGYQKAIDFDEGRKAVQASSGNFDPTLRAAHAAAAANPVGRFMPGPEVDRIGEIVVAENPGGYKDYIREMPLIRKQDDPNNFGYADLEISPSRGTLYTDASGQPLGIQGPQMPASNANANGTSQALNAPQGGTTLLDVMERNQFTARESGTYPQVDISGEFKELETRLAAQGIAVPGGIRTMEQAEAALGQVLAGGGKFNAPGSRQIVDNPGAAEALEKMRYTQPEVARLSNALIQTELGNRQNVNLDRKAAYQAGLAAYPYEMAQKTPDPTGPLIAGPQQLSIAQRNAEGVANGRSDGGIVRPAFGESEAMGDFNAGPELESANSRVKPRFAGLTGENMEGTPEEKKAALADAQRPYTGMVKGEAVGIEGKRDNPNLRYNRTGKTNEGDIRTALTQQAMERAKKTDKKVDMVQVERNARNAVAVQRRADEYAARPATTNEKPVSEEIARRKNIADHIGREKPVFKGRRDGVSETSRQQIAVESTGVPTYLNMEMPQQTRAPRMTNAMLGELAALNSAGKPEQGPTRPLTADLKAELNALDGGRGGGPKNPGGGYMVAPDGPSNNRGYMSAPEGPGIGRRARNVRRGAGIAAGIAGAAGIGAAINNERQKREEEAMYR